MSISLLFDKLSGKLQVKLQFVSDYNNVYGYSLVVFCLFFINFINSWFHSWTIRYLFLSRFGFLSLFQSFPSCNIIVFFIHILYNKFYNKFWFYSFPLVSILYGFSCWPYLTYMVSCKLSCKLLIITCVRFVIICDGYLLVITCKCSKKKFPVIDEWWTGLCRNMLLFRYLNNDRFPFV